VAIVGLVIMWLRGGYWAANAGLIIKWLLSGYGVAMKGLLSGYSEDIGRPLRGSLLSGY